MRNKPGSKKNTNSKIDPWEEEEKNDQSLETFFFFGSQKPL